MTRDGSQDAGWGELKEGEWEDELMTKKERWKLNASFTSPFPLPSCYSGTVRFLSPLLLPWYHSE